MHVHINVFRFLYLNSEISMRIYIVGHSKLEFYLCLYLYRKIVNLT